MKQFLMIIILLLVGCSSISTRQSVNNSITVSDINKKYDIIGPLGYKLGEIITVKAKVIEPPKERKGGGNWILVKEVNDNKLRNPIYTIYNIHEFSDVKELTIGNDYILKGYQDGGMIGTPENVMVEIDHIYQSLDYHFFTDFVIIGKQSDNKILQQTATNE